MNYESIATVVFGAVACYLSVAAYVNSRKAKKDSEEVKKNKGYIEHYEGLTKTLNATVLQQGTRLNQQDAHILLLNQRVHDAESDHRTCEENRKSQEKEILALKEQMKKLIPPEDPEEFKNRAK